MTARVFSAPPSSMFNLVKMPSKTGKFLPEPGLLLVLLLAFLAGSLLPHGAASSPHITQQTASVEHPAQGSGHNVTKKPFPVLDLDYPHIQTPFEIALWVLLASLMKLGEWPPSETRRVELSVFVFTSSQVMLG